MGPEEETTTWYSDRCDQEPSNPRQLQTIGNPWVSARLGRLCVQGFMALESSAFGSVFRCKWLAAGLVLMASRPLRCWVWWCFGFKGLGLSVKGTWSAELRFTAAARILRPPTSIIENTFRKPLSIGKSLATCLNP